MEHTHARRVKCYISTRAAGQRQAQRAVWHVDWGGSRLTALTHGLTIRKLDAGRADRTASEGAMKALVPASRKTKATKAERTLENMLS